MISLLPTPKLVKSRRGTFRKRGTHVLRRASPFSKWFSECLRQDFGIQASPKSGNEKPAVHFGLLKDLVRDGLAEA